MLFHFILRRLPFHSFMTHLVPYRIQASKFKIRLRSGLFQRDRFTLISYERMASFQSQPINAFNIAVSASWPSNANLANYTPIDRAYSRSAVLLFGVNRCTFVCPAIEGVEGIKRCCIPSVSQSVCPPFHSSVPYP